MNIYAIATLEEIKKKTQKKMVQFFLGLFFILVSLSTAVFANDSIQSSNENQRILRNVISVGGSTMASTSHMLFSDIDSLESPAEVLNTHKIFPSIANMIVHPNAITDLTGFELDASSISLSWTVPQFMDSYSGLGNGNYDVRWSSGGGMRSELSFSTANAFNQDWQSLAPLVGPSGKEVGRVITGVQPGTTIYVAVKAYDNAKNRAYVSSGSIAVTGIFISSRPSAPLNFNVRAVSQNQLNWEWSDVSNNEVGFRLMASTGGAASADLPINTTFYVQTLTGPNTSYSAYVQVYNRFWSSSTVVLSSFTLAEPPSVFSIHHISYTFVSSTWSTNFNPVNFTTYTMQVSENINFSPVINSSSVRINSETLAAATAAVSGLTPNTSYFYRIQTFNGDGVASQAVVDHSTFVTLAAKPTFNNYSSSFRSIIVTWDINSNPVPDTRYTIQISTEQNFADMFVATTSVLTGNVTSYTGLHQNTTYFFRVKSTNRLDVETDWVYFPERVTGVTIPEVMGYDIYLTSVSISLGKNGNSIGTQMQVSSDSLFSSALTFSALASGSEPAAVISILNLTPNTSYSFYARAVNHVNESSATFVTSTVTYAATPFAPLFSKSYISTATLLWSNPFQNPLDTRYQVQFSSDVNFMDVLSSSETVGFSVSTNSLIPNTSYYARARALNRYDFATGWVSAGSTVTLSTPISAVTISSNVYVSSTIFQWVNPIVNPVGTRYAVEFSSNGFNQISHSSITLLNNVIVHPLQPGTTYDFRIYVLNRMDAQTAVLSNSFKTLPAPEIVFNIAPSSIVVHWDKTVAAPGSEFLVQRANLLANGVTSAFTLTPWTANIGEWAFTELSTNTQYSFQVFWRETPASAPVFMVEKTTRTFAAQPGTPFKIQQSFTSLIFNTNPGTNPTAEPNNTEFAIWLRATGSELDNKFAPADGNMDHASATPVWRTYSQWGGSFGIPFTNIVGGYTYNIYVIARNGYEVTTSSSIPVVFTASPDDPIISWKMGLSQNSWINFAITSFTATNSAHYHYVFSQNEIELDVPAKNTIMEGPGINTHPFVERTQSFFTDEVVRVTATAEGVWYFHTVGDGYGFSGSNFHISVGYEKFKVRVDLTSPTISNLKAQYSPSDNTAITSNQNTAQREIYFTWTSSITDATKESPIVGYSVLMSTDADPGDVAVPLSTLTATHAIYFPVVNQTLNSPDRPAGTYYIRIKAKDEAGNWGASELFIYKVVDDIVQPTAKILALSDYKTHDDSYMSVRSTPLAIQVLFDKEMKPNTFISSSSVLMYGIKNNLSETKNTQISLNLSYNETTKILTITPENALAKGWQYEINLSTDILDLGGNALSASVKVRFWVVMDRNITNLVQASDGKTLVRIPAGSLPEDASISVGVLSGGVSAASLFVNAPKAVLNSAGGMHAPQFTAQGSIDSANQKVLTRLGAYAQPVSVREFTAITVDGKLITDSFKAPLTLVIPFLDEDKDGYVDGTSPKVKVKKLALYTLDEKTNVWQKLPAGEINVQDKTASAAVSHFSVYAVFGSADTDVSLTYAYPVPYKPSEGHNKITFAFLPNTGKIQIYTVDGQLVKQIDFDSPVDGKYDWDVTNSDGEKLGSDVYIYFVQSGDNKKTGKIMVIR